MIPIRIVNSLLLLTCISLFTGCSNITHFKASNLLPQPLFPKPKQVEVLSQQEPHLARLIIYRPRETLLSLPSSRNIELYADETKLADIKAGSYLVLDAPNFPNTLTVHWFDKEFPKISKILDLEIQINPGQQGIVRLSYEKNTASKSVLVAQNMEQIDAEIALPWLVETQPAWTSVQEQYANSF